MRRTMILAAFAAILTLTTAPAMAAVFGDGGTALQGVLDGITVGGPSSIDVTADNLADTAAEGTPYDSYWTINGTGGSLSTFIISIADYSTTNMFGIYDAANKDNFVTLFEAGGQTAGQQVLVGITNTGKVFKNFVDTGVTFDAGNMFGYFLDASVGNQNANAIFYSDTLLNADGIDHMFAYQGNDEDLVEIGDWAPGTWGSNEYILAWEDLYGGGDRDYTDFVVMVESVTPVPVPGAVLLGVLGLGAAGMRLRKRQS